ncbi:Scr1 family TA system antitoxin-like transcriptional regulator [Actinomadura welshii]
MHRQLLHLVEAASSQPRLCLRVLDIDARIEGGFPAKSPFTIYTFLDSSDSPMAVADTFNTDIVQTDTEDVRRYVELHERLWDASLSGVKSLTLLETTADRLAEWQDHSYDPPVHELAQVQSQHTQR